jgi:hypothetical protein
MAVNWALLNYYLRFATLALPLALLIHWLPPLRNVPWRPKSTRFAIAGLVIALLLNVAPVYLLVRIYQATHIRNATTVPMLALYPVRTGIYVIANGGNGQDGGVLNGYTTNWLGLPTHTNEELTYAVDFFELRTNGMIADSVVNKDIRTYEIFNETVYSPCIGKVIGVIDGNPGVNPLAPAGGSGDRLGNRVIIQCADFFVSLSNLRAVMVEVGEEVSYNRMVGQVGNTASDSIPSLHMYVTLQDGTPVPVLFEAGYFFRFVSRNFVYIR